jgi:protein-tyrosine-phosphatase
MALAILRLRNPARKWEALSAGLQGQMVADQMAALEAIKEFA